MTARRVGIESLAKINLDLRVLHKRDDGFHELRTVFQTISLADSLEIEFEPARRIRIALDDPLAIPDNLMLRAAEAVLHATKTRGRVRMRLAKKVPMGAGLGGGSSNAAAVLLALPVLSGRRLELDALIEIGSSLGSDVPFFLTGGTAVGIGRGSEFYSLPDVKREPILLVCPQVHVATAEAYRLIGGTLTVTEPSSRLKSFAAYVWTLAETRSLQAAGALSQNDFEAVVFRRHPQLRYLHGELARLGAAGARMTGSGSAIFGVFPSRRQREYARGVLERHRAAKGSRVEPAEVVSGRGYRALWRRQLGAHVTSALVWPLQSRYER